VTLHDDEPGHGNSPAAWTAVIIMLIAFTVGTVAFFLEMAWLVWLAVALLVVGLLAGVVMKQLGYGVGGHRLAKREHS
jgi:hypothetical protein